MSANPSSSAKKASGAKKISKSKAKMAAEAAKLAEEAQKAAEAEAERQRLEELRAAEQRARQAAAQAAFERAEAARLREEAESDEPFVVTRQADLSTLEEKLESERSWHYYLSCNPLPDVRSEAALSVYTTIWKAENNEGNEATNTPIHTYYDRILNSCALTENVIESLSLYSFEGREAFDFPLQSRCEKSIKDLREIINNKIDFLTAQFLTRADEYEDPETKSMQQAHSTGTGASLAAGNSSPLTASSELADLQYGLWVHTSAKHGRIKRIDFDSLQFHIELPVALQKSRTSIRVLRTASDGLTGKIMQNSHYSTEQPGFEETSKQPQPPLHFTSIGGLIIIEQCVLPPAPKKAKGWMIREITPLSKTVQLVPYPAQGQSQAQSISSAGVPATPHGDLTSPSNASAHLPPSGGLSSLPDDPNAAQTSATQAPLRVTFTLPRHLFLDDRDPHFGWFDQRNQCWRQEGIQLTSFEPATGKVSINLAIMKPFAVIQPRALDFPYREWSLKPVDSTSSDDFTPSDLVGSHRLTLLGSRFPVQIDLRPGLARLHHPNAFSSPDSSASSSSIFSPWNSSYCRPSHLFHSLEAIGLNVAPTLDDALYCRKPIKQSNFSDSLHGEIASCCGASGGSGRIFSIRQYSFNSSQSSHSALFSLQWNRPDFHHYWNSPQGQVKWKIYQDHHQILKEQKEKRLQEEESKRKEEENRGKSAVGDEEDSNNLEAANAGGAEGENAAANGESSAELAAAPVEEDSDVSLEDLRRQLFHRATDWLVVHAQLAPQLADGEFSQAPANSSDSPQLTFTIVRGTDLNGCVDLTCSDGTRPHISLRRALFDYLASLYRKFPEYEEELIQFGLSMDLYVFDEEFHYFPPSEEELLFQQTIKGIFNLTQPFIFH